MMATQPTDEVLMEVLLWCVLTSCFHESFLFSALWLSCTGRCSSAPCCCALLQPPDGEISWKMGPGLFHQAEL